MTAMATEHDVMMSSKRRDIKPFGRWAASRLRYRKTRKSRDSTAKHQEIIFRRLCIALRGPLPHSALRLMLSRMPMLARVQKSEVPPEEMSGRGMPLAGTSDSTTLMLKKACKRIAVERPKAVRRLKGSG